MHERDHFTRFARTTEGNLGLRHAPKIRFVSTLTHVQLCFDSIRVALEMLRHHGYAGRIYQMISVSHGGAQKILDQPGNWVPVTTSRGRDVAGSPIVSLSHIEGCPAVSQAQE